MNGQHRASIEPCSVGHAGPRATLHAEHASQPSRADLFFFSFAVLARSEDVVRAALFPAPSQGSVKNRRCKTFRKSSSEATLITPISQGSSLGQSTMISNNDGFNSRLRSPDPWSPLSLLGISRGTQSSTVSVQNNHHRDPCTICHASPRYRAHSKKKKKRDRDDKMRLDKKSHAGARLPPTKDGINFVIPHCYGGPRNIVARRFAICKTYNSCHQGPIASNLTRIR
ncbi:hypothetical protein FN846DRAFT_709087 [Sphaerosporella brunnea]|uniref:Uncharacterized protein n=1 Tax=Sphaerosporella brunnea TaxID=1250544 RepID=A0A5J5EXF3_9PEZI|nr:hypothetical protein FN846DRAFT_709087 [Sphaerosporella brunnea]